MTQKELKQLRHLKNEIRLLGMEYHNAKSTETIDFVTGSWTCIPYDKQVITIRGVDPMRLSRTRRKLERKDPGASE